MRILIGADIVPTKENVDSFVKGEARELIGGELFSLFKETDYTILNLETPLADAQTPINKAGENFVAPTDAINGLIGINPYLFCLANNHILDQGEQGLWSTVRALESNNVAYVGVGDNLQEASRPYIIAVDGVKIGVYACAEHEYSIVDELHAGANPFDPLYSFDHVKEARDNCDLLLVLYHGGKELYQYPSPNLQRVFRKFAEAGADIVVSQHTHCIGCFERYMNAMLVYGQGDFLFDHSNDEITMSSLVIQIDTDGINHQYSFVPIKRINGRTSLMDKEGKDRTLEEFAKRSDLIKKEGFICAEYNSLAKRERRNYLTGLLGRYGRFLPIRIINKILGYSISERNFKGKAILSLDNYLRCEAHRELLLTMCEMELKNE